MMFETKAGANIAGAEEDLVGFGTLPEATNALLQRGVLAYRTRREEGERLFQEALSIDPSQLPVYYCLYKIYTYQGRMVEAENMAKAGLEEAARQAGWSQNIGQWEQPAAPLDGAPRFALYTLKALAFINLKKGNVPEARRLLGRLKALDPSGQVGWPVVLALADALGMEKAGGRSKEARAMAVRANP